MALENHGEIKQAKKRGRNAKTAWKLLNECEYKKLTREPYE
jgi:hypothetical protein